MRGATYRMPRQSERVAGFLIGRGVRLWPKRKPFSVNMNSRRGIPIDMKRDMDLCRRILFAVESFPEDGVLPEGVENWLDVEVRNGNSETACLHHVWMLWSAGLLESMDCSSGDASYQSELLLA